MKSIQESIHDDLEKCTELYSEIQDKIDKEEELKEQASIFLDPATGRYKQGYTRSNG